jgi:hypothetical protein
MAKDPEISLETRLEIEEAGLKGLSAHMDDLAERIKNPFKPQNSPVEISFRFKVENNMDCVGTFKLDTANVQAIELALWSEAFFYATDSRGMAAEEASKYAFTIDPMIMIRNWPDGTYRILRNFGGN